MKKLSELVENMKNAVEILNYSYSPEQWEEKRTTDYYRLNHALYALADFEYHRDMEEIEWDVDVDDDELRRLYTDVEIAFDDFEHEFGDYAADGSNFYDLLLYCNNSLAKFYKHEQQLDEELENADE